VIVEDFFREIDQRWDLATASTIPLRVIGASALNLRAEDYDRGTDDADVIETADLARGIKERLIDLAGKGTALHVRRGMYLEIVPGGLPLLPHVPTFHPLDGLSASLAHFEIAVLDVVEVCVSKLKPFRSRDREDIRAMVKRNLVPHDHFVARVRDAVDVYADGAGAEDLRDIIRHFHQIERDVFGVPESEIELPQWLEDRL
jgi:hypothetical protein